MAINKRLLVKPPSTGITPSEHFGVVLYEGDGSTSHSINGGKFGAGAYFNGGSSDKILIGNNLKNIIFDEFSISTWFYVTETNNWQAIIGNTDSARDRGILLYVRGNNNKLVWNASETGAPGPYFSITSTVTLSANTWYHAVATFNNSTDSDGAKLYINGSLDISGQARTADIESSNNIHIGNSGLALDWPFHGKIDQTRFFTKALSSSEVSTLYAETVDTVESLDPLSEDTTDTLQVLGDSSCVATYRFENNEDDLSGNYDLTGNAIQYTAGRYGQAASFNGSSSYAEITSSPPQDNSGVMSVSFWAKTSSTSRSCFFIAEAPDPNKEFLKLENYGYQGTNSFRVSYDNNMLANINNQAISDGNWHHIVITAGNGNVKTYKDNSLLATQSVTITDRTLDNFVIGYRKYNTDLYFNGEIDQFRVFNKELSAAEVTTLYNENSLVASYRFEGNANDDMRAYDGTATNVTYEYGLGFTPDFVWYKTRTQAYDHNLSDSTRGAAKQVRPNRTIAEVSATDQILSFDTGGFTVGSGGDANKDGDDYVAWCLKANGGTTSSNTDGSITTTVQANQDSGFSIIKYDMNVTTPTAFTIGHGLSAAPELVFFFSLDQSGSTSNIVYPNNPNKEIVLDNTGGFSGATSAYWNTTAPSSTVINMGTAWGQYHSYYGGDTIAYAFHSVEGFSKIGSYTGNGTTNGPIVETGFEPAFVMIKRTDSTGVWVMLDNKRNLTNPRNSSLYANTSAQEDTGSTSGFYPMNFYSNGFQPIQNTGDYNANGGTYLYLAIAADPDTEAPTVASSFNIETYTGTGAARSITGLGFGPGLVWTKDRGNAEQHQLHDIVRGPTHALASNLTNAEATRTGGLTSFDNDGFSLGADGGGVINDSARGPYVAWAWKADDNEPKINTEGSIDSLVSANANAGFSIVKYIGDGSTSLTSIGHGLSAAPELIIQKSITNPSTYGTNRWRIGGTVLGGAGKYMFLDLTNAVATNSNEWGNTQPDATKFYVSGTAERSANESGIDYINYCFHSVSGYSKFGTYNGNGSGSGQTITTGFQPDWIILKCTNIASEWVIVDSVRGDAYLLAESSGAEVSPYTAIDFLSTGFKLTGTSYNESNKTFIYWTHKIN